MSKPVLANRETEAVAFFHRRGRLALGQFLKRGFTHIAPAIPHATVEQHLTKMRRVLRRREKSTCGNREAASAIRERIGQLGDLEFREVRLGAVRAVRFGHALDLSFVRPESGILHSERPKQTLLHKVLIRQPRDHLNDATGDVNAGAGVEITRPRFTHEGRDRITAHQCRQRHEVVGWQFERGHERYAAHMIEHLTKGYGMGRLPKQRVGGVLLHRDHLTAKFGEIFLHRIVERDLAFIHQHHQRRRRHGFRLGRDPEQRVGFHGLAAGDVGKAQGFDREHLVPTHDNCDRPGEFMPVDKRLK